MRNGGERRGNAQDRAARKARLLQEYAGRCVWCGVSDGPWHADRLVPGGSYRRENVVLSCESCNERRNGGHTRYARETAHVRAGLIAGKVRRYGKRPA